MNEISFQKQAEEHQLSWRERNEILLGQNGTQNGSIVEVYSPKEQLGNKVFLLKMELYPGAFPQIVFRTFYLSK